MKKYISTFVCGFVAGILHIVPLAKSLSCCLIIPAAAFFSLMLDQKARDDFSKIIPSKAVIFGLLTGLFAALFGTFFEVMITFITKNNDIVASLPQIKEMISEFPASEVFTETIEIFQQISDEIKQSGFSLLYSVILLLNNLIIDPLFGLIGGLVGMQILNSKNAQNNQ